MKVMILVLSSVREPWGALMSAQQETWDSVQHPQTHTLYYCAHNKAGPIRPDVRYSSMDDWLEHVSPRTVEAFGWALESEWDYLCRPNSSCYVHKEGLVKFCETLPAENVLRGGMTGGNDPFLWGGCQYIMSRDVVQRMYDTRIRWRCDLMDDQSITKSAQAIGLDLHQGPMACAIDSHEDGTYTCVVYGPGETFKFTDFAEVPQRVPGHFMFRVKQDLRRHLDVQMMHQLKGVLP